jgi:hypothetical protein
MQIREDHQHLDGQQVLKVILAGGLGSLLLQEEVRSAEPAPCSIMFFNMLHILVLASRQLQVRTQQMLIVHVWV